ncbi:uncharacterized protein LOC111375005 isoform X2 [Olea europaea var. sylvestris]|uniref:uncharacterized protein LOC111375005 isoform X2 n=1 Tax=Olea europaea var. sylvestris TaxID=158386 RepID=UPI000C1D7E60|nr:uncharacterized protein LOC111375005 isoform X2 [Olea europaea var. sylvestris]
MKLGNLLSHITHSLSIPCPCQSRAASLTISSIAHRRRISSQWSGGQLHPKQDYTLFNCPDFPPRFLFSSATLASGTGSLQMSIAEVSARLSSTM